MANPKPCVPLYTLEALTNPVERTWDILSQTLNPKCDNGSHYTLLRNAM